MARWTMSRLVRSSARSPAGRFALRVTRDLVDLGLIDRGMTLAAHTFTSVLPILIAFLVPEATMAQRISRAKQRLAGIPLDQPGDLSRVLRVLYLLFNEGYSGEIDIAAEAIRVTRQLAALNDEPEVSGLLALMLLHHARRPARVVGGRLVPLAQQDRSLWDVDAITEGVAILQSALARDRLGQYQAQAAIAALHADAPTAAETDWVRARRMREIVGAGDLRRDDHAPGSTTSSRASAGSSAASSAWTQVKRRSESEGIWNLRGFLPTSAARSSLGKANSITLSSRENAT